jgi:hypothetical protein
MYYILDGENVVFFDGAVPVGSLIKAYEFDFAGESEVEIIGTVTEVLG